jgi:hypothetical protein
MPKIPGRADTKRKVRVEDVLVGSFMMDSEEWAWRRVCAIEGCDHRMGPKTDEPGWATNWRSCDDQQLASNIAFESTLRGAGMACPCCTTKILDYHN